MTSDTLTLDLRRQFFADEIEAVARLRTPALPKALATVRRERFLPPGPWITLGDLDFLGPARQISTPDDDPARVYHNIGIAIDPARQLYNGQPATLATWIDALGLAAGQRVVHIGAGLGYYTALMAHIVGPQGRVIAYEVDAALADSARENLKPYPWIDLRSNDASIPLDAEFDAMLVNAGVTHPLDSWLDRMAVGGRMLLPLTTAMPAMGATIGKGLGWLITRKSPAEYTARVAGIVAVYSAVGLRDERLSERIGKSMMAGPMKWQSVTRLRRDPHEAGDSCWLHDERFCLSA
jgi:protein-L-isoaspartate(D-aspartate) O-methyltransferase